MPVAFLGLALLLVSCGSSSASNVATSAGTVAVTPSPSPAPSSLTAAQVVDRLKATGLPVGQVDVYSASTDSNGLLGRPGQYASKANFVDSRALAARGGSPPTPGAIPTDDGGSVEVFATSADCVRRAAYIKSVTQSIAFLVEYDYTDGVVLLRLAHALTPDQASAYKTALEKLVGAPAQSP